MCMCFSVVLAFMLLRLCGMQFMLLMLSEQRVISDDALDVLVCDDTRCDNFSNIPHTKCLRELVKNYRSKSLLVYIMLRTVSYSY